MSNEIVETGSAPGDFPFPTTDGSQESRYLTWIRNHSNYMGVRGLLDYIRAVAVLVRGALLNALIGLPYLLVSGVVVALFHVLPEAPGFVVTPWFVLFAVTAVVSFPFVASLLRIKSYRKSQQTGTDSSVPQRDRWERRFGKVLILVLAVAAFEALPAFLGDFHFWVHDKELGWPALSAVAGVVLAVYSGFEKLLSALGGVARKLAILAVGGLGLLMPLLVVLLTADYLVFTRPDVHSQWTYLPFGAALAMCTFINVALILGVFTRAFSSRDIVWVVALLCLLTVSAVLAYDGRNDYGRLVEKGENDLIGKVKSIWDEQKFDKDFDDLARDVDGKPGPFLKQLKHKIATARFTPLPGRDRDNTADEQDDQLWKAQAEPRVRLKASTEQIAAAAVMRRHSAPKDESMGGASSDGTAPALRGGASSDGTAPALRGGASSDGTAPALRGGASSEEPQVQVARRVCARFKELVVAFKDSSLYEFWQSACNEKTAREISELPAEEMIRLGDSIALLLELPKQPGGNLVPFIFNYDSDLVSHIFKVDSDGVRRPKPYVLLGRKFPDTFPGANAALDSWYSLLNEGRLEIATRLVYSPTVSPAIYKDAAPHRRTAVWNKVTLVLSIAAFVWLFCWLTIDVNLTSIHGLYRDRLASAFLIGADTKGDVDIEEDLDLGDICRHEAGSIAPYHLINAALNLQGSRDIGLRDRRSDYFVFSKRFIGGNRTGYCRSETMERVFPEMGLAAAMAISAAAASPNMGRSTSPALTAFMTLLNVRLGIWVPNPGLLQKTLEPYAGKPEDGVGLDRGFSFAEVFREELVEIQKRWGQLPGGSMRRLVEAETQPSVRHGLVGIGFSGGGIRSATINLGIAQALHRRGVFDHLDYMSTVSGGGYLGSSISALMRRRTRTESEIAGRATVRTNEVGETVVEIRETEPGWLRRLLLRTRGTFARTRQAGPTASREYRYAGFAQLAVKDGDRVEAGQRLLGGVSPSRARDSFGQQFRWRVRPGALLREMSGRLDEEHRWVNVSDGGHIENLAGIELLRRRCKYILIGDGEADPDHGFNGLATLIRAARIDLGIRIDIDVSALRLHEDDKESLCSSHWAIGRVQYPNETERGYLLYLKSSLSGDEEEVIREYRYRNPSFPHESTADQMFTEGQFEAYRSLGQHIGEQALRHLLVADDLEGAQGASFVDLERWFAKLDETRRAKIDVRSTRSEQLSAS